MMTNEQTVRDLFALFCRLRALAQRQNHDNPRGAAAGAMLEGAASMTMGAAFRLDHALAKSIGTPEYFAEMLTRHAAAVLNHDNHETETP